MCVCVSVSLSPPPDTAGKAANGGKGENELEGKKIEMGGPRENN